MNRRSSDMLWAVFSIACIFILFNSIQSMDNEKLDKKIARDILMDVYKPIYDFAINTESMTDINIVKMREFRSKDDFVSIISKIDNGICEDTFEYMTENMDEGFIDARVYIPTIYNKTSRVDKAYIKKKNKYNSKHKLSKEELKPKLIIKESWKISGEYHHRTNELFKNDSDNWVLKSSSGTMMYKFVDASNNPWSIKRNIRN